MNTITSINHLQQIAGVPDSNGFDGFISLAGGLARSSKQIWYDAIDDSWFIRNDIDDSEVEYSSTSDFISGEPNIIQAINVGALFSYGP